MTPPPTAQGPRPTGPQLAASLDAPEDRFLDAPDFATDRPADTRNGEQQSPAVTGAQTFESSGGLQHSTQQVPTVSGADPLSNLIHKRTQASKSPRKHNRRGSEDTAASAVAPNIPKATDNTDTDPGDAAADQAQLREKRKGVKFLARLPFMPTAKRRDSPDGSTGSAVEDAKFEERPEGAEADAFYQPVDYVGYNPKYPQPPGYIKVRARYKKDREFDRVFLAQELDDRGSSLNRTDSVDSTRRKLRKERNLGSQKDAVWAMSFSGDGRYVAVAGQDRKIRVWAVLHTREDRRRHEKDEEAEGIHEATAVHLSAPVFCTKPRRVYESHTGPVLDLCWSKNNFLLSSSMDKTVRLWHVSRSECLCAFKHSEVVTSVRFHPKDDRFFLAGSLDCKLRLWSIPDKSVAFWNNVPDMITAVGFTPDGKTAIAGCMTGFLHFYDTEGLKVQTQLLVRSAHGKNAKGSKITGIDTAHVPESDGPVKLLVTSNDSRIRLINFRDKSIEMKFKGLENVSSQIHARFSDDAKHVICGSEDNKVYIWSTDGVDLERKNKWPMEVFEAHSAMTTCAVLAPARTRQHLSASEDPLYDLCNPPPVHLLSRSESDESNASKQAKNSSSLPHEGSPVNGDGTSSIQPTPATAEGFHKPAHSPAYLAKALHADCGGRIIVTADALGAVKVFRQDCAYDKRRTASDAASLLSRKMANGSASSSIIRRPSQATHNSGLSRNNSLSSLGPAPGTGRERINSWRQSIGSTPAASSTGGALNRHGSTGSFRSSMAGTRASGIGLGISGGASSNRSASPANTSLGVALARNPTNSSTKSADSPVEPKPGIVKAPTFPLPRFSLHRSKKSDPSVTASKGALAVPKIARQDTSQSSSFSGESDLSVDDDDDGDEDDDQANDAYLSASEEPSHSYNHNSQHQHHHHHDNRKHDAGRRPSRMPAEIMRSNSSVYWMQDAWKDAIVGQLGREHQPFAPESDDLRSNASSPRVGDGGAGAGASVEGESQLNAAAARMARAAGRGKGATSRGSSVDSSRMSGGHTAAAAAATATGLGGGLGLGPPGLTRRLSGVSALTDDSGAAV